MLYKSGINLEDGVVDFIRNNESITLFSAYIKLNQLKKINVYKNIKQIVVRWEIQDLCLGVSDIELYLYCRENNIVLYRNTRLHMKVFWNNMDSLVFGSANVSGRGLGELKNFNYELNGLNADMGLEEIMYLDNVIACSEYVTDTLYNKLFKIMEESKIPVISYPILDTAKENVDSFLLSQLPMSLSPDDLYEVSVNSKDFEIIEITCASHDIALFDINPYQNYTDFKVELKVKFNSHPFTIALKEYIKSQETKSLRYGAVVDWIQKNTTTVPTPRSWEIKREQIVNILYTWICEFDDNFTWNVPGSRSEVITYYEQ